MSSNLECCIYCGKFVLASESTIRQGVDNEPEIICNTCLENEQQLISSTDDTNDMSIAKLVSVGIIDCGRCCAFEHSVNT